MKLSEILDTPTDASKLIDLLKGVSNVNMDREVALSKLYHLLSSGTVDSNLLKNKYRLGRVIRVNDLTFRKLKEGDDLKIDFYSNKVIPHFKIEGSGFKQAESLIRAGVGGIVPKYDDPSDTELLSSYFVVAYEVPTKMLDIQISLADVLEKLNATEKYKSLYLKALREQEVLAINKDGRNIVIPADNIIAYGRISNGYKFVDASIKNL